MLYHSRVFERAEEAGGAKHQSDNIPHRRVMRGTLEIRRPRYEVGAWGDGGGRGETLTYHVQESGFSLCVVWRAGVMPC